MKSPDLEIQASDSDLSYIGKKGKWSGHVWWNGSEEVSFVGLSEGGMLRMNSSKVEGYNVPYLI